MHEHPIDAAASSSARPDASGAGPISRRSAIAAFGAGVAGVTAVSSAAGTNLRAAQASATHGVLTAAEAGWDAEAGTYTLPALPYANDALEPVIDAQTMEIHHTRHHAGYIRGMGVALEELAKVRAGTGDARLVKHWSRELSFHASGHLNHALFWQVMAPRDAGGGGRPEGRLAELIERDFGGFERFQSHFVAASASVEGSGWGWLVWDPMAGRLMVTQGEKQQNFMVTGVQPLLGLDVWEHAYYLRYQNRRRAYCEAFFEIINWAKVSELLDRVAPVASEG
jgi:Fe-Mn family superoxide dismutase